MNIKAILIGAGIFLATPTWADGATTIADLLDQCRAVGGWSEFARGTTDKPPATDEWVKGSFCLGYINGLTEGHALAVVIDDQRREWAAGALGELLGLDPMSPEDLEAIGVKGIGSVLRYCAPGGAKVVQYAAIFVAWADRHPQRWDESKRVGVLTALEEAYPCENGVH